MTNKEAFTKFFHRPVFEDAHCISCCSSTPCPSCNWWNKEYADSEEKKPSFKIFISQPMKDRPAEEILQERKEIESKWAMNQSVEIIDSFFCEPGKNSIDSLGKSISLMRDADLVVFAPGWETARGCRVEYEVAKEYGIQIAYYIRRV